jgi:hypothetical protein
MHHGYKESLVLSHGPSHINQLLLLALKVLIFSQFKGTVRNTPIKLLFGGFKSKSLFFNKPSDANCFTAYRLLPLE